MEVVDFLLDGLEAALELERELGAKIVDILYKNGDNLGRFSEGAGSSSSGNPRRIRRIPSLGLPLAVACAPNCDDRAFS